MSDGSRRVDPWVHSVSALVAGVVSTTVTHPLDLVKARFQTQHVARSGTKGVPLQYRNTLQAFGLIWKREGFRGWYRGCVPNILGNGVSSWKFVIEDVKKIVSSSSFDRHRECDRSSSSSSISFFFFLFVFTVSFVRLGCLGNLYVSLYLA